jgi:hypothetical protein
MASIAPDSIIRKNDDIFTGMIDNELVAMNIQNGKYYHLNETGARIFALLEEPRSVSDICRELEGSYNVAGNECRQDVLAFLQEMAGYSLIVAE